MCLATPMKIIEIKGKTAIVKTGSHKHKVNLTLIKNPEVHDYVLAHGNIAINKIPKDEAEKILKMIEMLNNKNYASK